ncbi:hypothetical protein B4096_1292 [Heyndrickxia coagulans]|nr:hypothetical protein B4100_1360 [Heyndrickxia coagulans]KYC89329.1 hypothetical protein B4096_1292 [Heyndrickxia coagulans]
MYYTIKRDTRRALQTTCKKTDQKTQTLCLRFFGVRENK